MGVDCQQGPAESHLMWDIFRDPCKLDLHKLDANCCMHSSILMWDVVWERQFHSRKQDVRKLDTDCCMHNSMSMRDVAWQRQFETSASTTYIKLSVQFLNDSASSWRLYI